MILVSLCLLGLGVADLVRWSPDRAGAWRVAAAAISGAAVVGAVAALSDMGVASVLAVVAVAFSVLWLWSGYDLLPEKHARPEYALALVIGLIAVLLALSGSADPVHGDLASWYSRLGFGVVDEISVDQFVLGIGAALFLLVTGNRLVRYTLTATEASLAAGEGTLRGGRVLGPMERLIVAAAVVAGGVAGAGFVIAAKGLLRFREIRDPEAAQPKVDEITEYFLIGTFTSILIASAMALLVSAAA